MTTLYENAHRLAMVATKRLNDMEDKIAMEWYGCKFEELDEFLRGEVSFEAHDRIDELDDM